MLGNAANRGQAIRGWLINKITLLYFILKSWPWMVRKSCQDHSCGGLRNAIFLLGMMRQIIAGMGTLLEKCKLLRLVNIGLIYFYFYFFSKFYLNVNKDICNERHILCLQSKCRCYVKPQWRMHLTVRKAKMDWKLEFAKLLVLPHISDTFGRCLKLLY